MKAAFDEIPAAVPPAVIAPTVLVTGWPETAAAAVTVVAAARLHLLAIVAVGIVTVDHFGSWLVAERSSSKTPQGCAFGRPHPWAGAQSSASDLLTPASPLR